MVFAVGDTYMMVHNVDGKKIDLFHSLFCAVHSIVEGTPPGTSLIQPLRQRFHLPVSLPVIEIRLRA